jgi:dsRNA-specific ribonuclease
VQVLLQNGMTATGEGGSKRVAEMAAARHLLDEVKGKTKPHG